MVFSLVLGASDLELNATSYEACALCMVLKIGYDPTHRNKIVNYDSKSNNDMIAILLLIYIHS